ncbi:MAG: molybdopterin-dependent oxidoreductase [Gemmatimonadaceae bacterium]|nr:molybdopterin-dependent oxidoreductase [Gemmatimonadaceae bacterium]
MSESRILKLRTVALIDRSVHALEAVASTAVEDVRRREIGRRHFLTASATSLAAAFLAGCDSSGPKSAEKVLAYATRKNELVEQWLLRHTSMDEGSPGASVAGARFPSYFVSRTVPIHDEAVSGAWRLEVSGLVRTPLSLSREQLAAMPRRTQRVNHFCVEGWNAVAEFAGVSVGDLAKAAGVLPSASVVDFQSFDAGYHESWDIESALHPQTLIVYAKDGVPLTPAYGAPARVHSPIKLGYKNTKYLTKVVFQAERNGGYWSDRGYEWFGGT